MSRELEAGGRFGKTLRPGVDKNEVEAQAGSGGEGSAWSKGRRFDSLS